MGFEFPKLPDRQCLALAYCEAIHPIAQNLIIGHDYVMSGCARKVMPTFKDWWPARGLLVCDLVGTRWWAGWSGGFLAARTIAGGVYVGTMLWMPAGRCLAVEASSPPPPSIEQA